MPPCDHSRIATALPRIAAVHDAPHALNRYSLSRRIAILTAVRVVILVTITWLAFVPSAPAKEDGNTLRQTHVLPQDLGTALEALAKDFDFQILYPTEMVKNLKSKGATGSLTAEEALVKVLEGTGLTYDYLDKKAVAILPIDSGVGAEQRSTVDAAAGVDPLGKKGRGAFGGASKDPSSLAEIVVTAEKREERLQDAPVPVSVVMGEALVADNELHLQDYYLLVPGLALSTGFHGEPYIAIRGITTDIYSNPSVAIAIDDVPYGSSTAIGGGNIAPDIDPNDLARVEVLRGPQGTLYGANSLGGLIKYVTLAPSTDGFSGRIQTGTTVVQNGIQPGYDVRASVNVPLSDTWAIRASTYKELRPGFIDNIQSGARAVNRANADGVQVSSLWRPDDILSLKLSAMIQDWNANGLSEVSQQGLSKLQQDALAGTGRYDTNVQSYSANLTADFKSFSVTSLTGYNVHTAYAWFDNTAIYGTYAEQTFGLAGASGGDRRRTSKVSEELRFSLPLGQRIEWLVGGFYTHENSPYAQNYYPANPATGMLGESFAQAQFQSTYSEYAGFTDITLRITDRFDVQFGARESRISQSVDETLSGVLVGPMTETFGSSDASAFTYLVTPRLKLSKDLMVYARLASGYRPGGPNTNAAFQGLPPQFEPDRTHNYEVGLKGQLFDHALSFDTSVYDIDWKNIQIPLTENGFSYYANGSRAESRGFELSAQAKPFTGTTISGWIAWADAKLTEALPPNSAKFGRSGDRLPNTPRFSGNLAVEETLPLSNHLSAFVGVAIAYVGSRVGSFQPAAERQYFPGYAKLDLKAGTQYDRWAVNVFLNNVADRRGLLGGGLDTIPTTSFTIIQPRTGGISLSRTF